MKVWNQEIDCCGNCPYSDSYDRNWECTYDDHEIITGFNTSIDKECPFNKPINEEALGSLGFDGPWKDEEEHPNEKGYFKSDEKNPHLIRIGENYIIIERYSQVLFKGILNNPEELKFILKRLNIIE